MLSAGYAKIWSGRTYIRGGRKRPVGAQLQVLYCMHIFDVRTYIRVGLKRPMGAQFQVCIFILHPSPISGMDIFIHAETAHAETVHGSRISGMNIIDKDVWPGLARYWYTAFLIHVRHRCLHLFRPVLHVFGIFYLTGHKIILLLTSLTGGRWPRGNRYMGYAKLAGGRWPRTVCCMYICILCSAP